MNNDRPVSVSEFVASDSPYLCKEQIAPLGVIRVVIDRVTKSPVPVSGTSRTEDKYVLWFKNAKKGLVVGARRNRKWLAKMMGGTKTSEWEGKAVWLYVDEGASFGGQRVGGIRFALGTEYSGETCGPPQPTPINAEPTREDPSDNGVDPDRKASLDQLAAEGG